MVQYIAVDTYNVYTPEPSYIFSDANVRGQQANCASVLVCFYCIKDFFLCDLLLFFYAYIPHESSTVSTCNC